MGQSSSLPSSLPDLALHVLRVADHSPASGHLEPFFDYLVGVEVPTSTSTAASASASASASLQAEGGGSIEGFAELSPAELGRILEANEGRKVGLKVYNAKSQRIRGEFEFEIESECWIRLWRALRCDRCERVCEGCRIMG
jgi:hypothetical protein